MLPLAYALAFRAGLGVLGIWVAFAAGLLAIAGALLFFVRRALRTPMSELQLRVSRASGKELAIEAAG
jgi:Na+-driven multidrug efflux pump